MSQSLIDVRALPRSTWDAHPNFPTQTLLLASHANFRRVSAHLIEHPEHSLYRRWIRAMRSHEHYEERKLYPFLERRWGVSFADAIEGHEALHRLEGDVLAAFASGRGASEAMREHDEVLRAHLDLEEDLVIPMLLELRPEEFRRYYYS